MKLKNLVEANYGNAIDLSNSSLVQLPNDLPKKILGDFNCSNNELTSLEHCTSEVGRSFYCSSNDLTSLEFCPSEVGRSFYCTNNELKSLDFCPSEVGGTFNCSYNRLTSLEFCPSEVGGAFNCTNNELASLRDIHRQIKKIHGDFYCYVNPIKSHVLGLMLVEIGGKILTKLGNGSDVDEILNRWKNQGRRGVLGAQHELLELGYKDLAQL